jgi:hypothetical protein
MTDLNTIDAVALADLIGELDRKAKTASKALEDAKAELKTRGLPSIVGDEWMVTVSTETVTALDQDLVKKLLGKDLPRFQKTSVRTVVRIKAALVKEEAA